MHDDACAGPLSTCPSVCPAQLDVLAGNVMDGCTMEGSITVNGTSLAHSDFKRHSCYVQQKDVLLSSATVSTNV